MQLCYQHACEFSRTSVMLQLGNLQCLVHSNTAEHDNSEVKFRVNQGSNDSHKANCQQALPAYDQICVSLEHICCYARLLRLSMCIVNVQPNSARSMTQLSHRYCMATTQTYSFTVCMPRVHAKLQTETKYSEVAEAVSSPHQGAGRRQTVAIFSATGCEHVSNLQCVSLRFVALKTRFASAYCTASLSAQ